MAPTLKAMLLAAGSASAPSSARSNRCGAWFSVGAPQGARPLCTASSDSVSRSVSGASSSVSISSSTARASRTICSVRSV